MTPPQPRIIIFCQIISVRLPVKSVCTPLRVLSHAVKSPSVGVVRSGQSGELHTLWLPWEWVIRMCLQTGKDKTITMRDLQHWVRSSVCTTCQSRAASLTGDRSAVWVEPSDVITLGGRRGQLPLGYFTPGVGVEMSLRLHWDPWLLTLRQEEVSLETLKTWVRETWVTK